MSKTLHRNLQAKMDNLQGPEWDSSDEETEKVVKAKGASKKQKKQTAKEQAISKMNKDNNKKAKKNAMTKEDEAEKDATVLYIGHLPSEFEERDLRNFLMQFGKVVNIRISRSLKTGNSRGYAFVRWEDAETARVVADTLQGYFVGQRRLVCHAVPNAHKGMFYNTDKVIQQRQLKRKVEEKERERTLANAGKIKEITVRLVQRERKKRAKLEALGIDYDFPGYEASQMDDDNEEVEDKMETQESSLTLDDDEEEAPQSDKKGKQKKRKDSVESIGSTSSSRKRKDSVGSESSATKKAKRKDSVGSEANAGSPHSDKKKSKKVVAKETEPVKTTPAKSTKKLETKSAKTMTPEKSAKKEQKQVQSETKAKKSKKNKKRRESVP